MNQDSELTKANRLFKSVPPAEGGMESTILRLRKQTALGTLSQPIEASLSLRGLQDLYAFQSGDCGSVDAGASADATAAALISYGDLGIDTVSDTTTNVTSDYVNSFQGAPVDSGVVTDSGDYGGGDGGGDGGDGCWDCGDYYGS